MTSNDSNNFVLYATVENYHSPKDFILDAMHLYRPPPTNNLNLKVEFQLMFEKLKILFQFKRNCNTNYSINKYI